jgi:hypothetical protein
MRLLGCPPLEVLWGVGLGEWRSKFSGANSIFWLTSPRPDEVRMVETMTDDVSVICKARDVPFQSYVVPSGDQVIRSLAENRERCTRRLPASYLSRHTRSPTEGVEIAAGNEMVAWEKVVDALRRSIVRPETPIGHGRGLLRLVYDNGDDHHRSY